MAEVQPTAARRGVASHVELSRRAVRDLRPLGPGIHQHQIRADIDALAASAPNLNIRALEGCAPWLRLRQGDYRLLYRPLRADELQERSGAANAGFLVERIVHRRDLEQAVTTLS
jgi:mRNA-degrading endonuclease RelE of RelBE toxin-antitoxin system